MIDLSYLTEEEQEMIVAVLKRDAELKKADEERIKQLQKAVRNTDKLKYLTGEWFYETKSQRHRDRIHGSDIIRAAMTQRKPMTILELTQIWTERPSFVNSELQDIFVPAELSGLIEEPSGQPTKKRANGSASPDVQKDGVMLALQSPAKRRKNPFNSALVLSEGSERRRQQFTNEEPEQITASEEELLPPSKSHIGSLAKINSEDADQHEYGAESTAPQVSTTQGPEDQKGKPVHAKVQGRGLSSRPAEQSHGLAEEQGPIAKVLEWFSWSSDGSNQYDNHSRQRVVQESDEEFGILEDAASVNQPIVTADFSRTHSIEAESQKPRNEPSEEKVNGPEGSDTEAQTLYGDVEQMTDGSTLMKYPVLSLYTAAATQGESCITASENKLRQGTEGKLTLRQEAQDKTPPLSHPVNGESLLRLANLKSFWEKENCGPSILISKTVDRLAGNKMTELAR
ncbi:hypothetical protein SKAU_G00262140 [Synaphobranchus kaupii]|uniref:RabBD domain-containing protein n=1 Tax=Synaphobranchus kaupii TaxID=118154 RepID=A0A9Q1INT0_SYNKA|nr:hypothetical protein SKAU_G00262140 [Synaphobranchus kaupii]